jgi:gamma-glutamyltranspeptidase/glutathione hydrolase
MSSSIEQSLGNGLVVPGRGFFLNSELTDFSPEGPNKIQSQKQLRRTALPPEDQSVGRQRPRSAMAPCIVSKEGK